MPRTVEGIVECHKAATERRAQGRPVWNHHIEIKKLFSKDDYPTNQAMHDTSKGILEVLRNKFKGRLEPADMGSFDMDLDDVVQYFQEIVDTAPKRGLEKRDSETLEALNEALDMLYDWADRARVWVG